MHDKPLFNAIEVVQARCPDPPLEVYVVVAYNAINRYWSVRNGSWLSEDAAKKEAAKLSSIWTSRRVYRIGD